MGNPKEEENSKPLNPAIAAGLGTFVLLNVGALCSLPSVLIGRGAPYLPTFKKNMDAMFTQLKKEQTFRKRLAQNTNQSQRSHEGTARVIIAADRSTELLSALRGSDDSSKSAILNNKQKDLQQRPLTFVDLGSGDGRLVFRAAREGIFDSCIGYEINPFLHVLAYSQRILRGPAYWGSMTQFYVRDLWNVDLRDADVVAVYGLGPIMKELGVKLKAELKPGSYVLSNVFSIPNWIPISSAEGTYIYRIPNDDHHESNEAT